MQNLIRVKGVLCSIAGSFYRDGAKTWIYAERQSIQYMEHTSPPRLLWWLSLYFQPPLHVTLLLHCPSHLQSPESTHCVTQRLLNRLTVSFMKTFTFATSSPGISSSTLHIWPRINCQLFFIHFFTVLLRFSLNKVNAKHLGWMFWVMGWRSILIEMQWDNR